MSPLPLDIDPKLAWALKFRERFPVDVNRAPREALLRVPGLGVRAVDALIRARRHRTLRLEDGAELWITTHPSYLLRLEDAARASQEARFAAALRAVAGRLAELAA